MQSKENYCDNGPDRLWQDCCAYAEEGRWPGKDDDEQAIREGVQFLVAWEKSTVSGFGKLRRRYPDLFAAHQMYRNPRSERWTVEAGLLTTVDLAELGSFVGRPKSVLETYGKYFYDVRGRLHEDGWVLNQVMMPAMDRGLHERDYDMMFKTVAYCHGWQFFRNWVRAGKLDKAAQSELRDAFRNNMLRLGFSATHKIELNGYTIPTVFDTCTRLIELEKEQSQGATHGSLQSALAVIMEECRTAVMPHDASAESCTPRAYEVFGRVKALRYGEPIPVDAKVKELGVAT